MAASAAAETGSEEAALLCLLNPYYLGMNSVQWTPKAARQLRKLDRAAQVDIRDAVTAKLPRFPDCSGVKALSHHHHQYRLRVGNYRVLFNHHRAIEIISIEEVKKRDEQTY